MKIAIDVSSVDSKKAGIGHYTWELVLGLNKIDNKNKYILVTNNKNNLPNTNLNTNFQIKEVKSSKPGFLWILKSVKYLRNNHIDILISPSILTFGILFKNTIQIIHDILPIKKPEFWSTKAVMLYKYQLKLESKRALAFATISDQSKQDLINYFPSTKNRTYKIGAGLNSWIYQKPSDSQNQKVKQKYKLTNNYFLSVGTLEPRKNHINMIKAFSKLAKKYKDYKYYIVGKKGWYYENIFKTVRELKLEDKVKFLGYVSDEDLTSILALAKGFLFVSFDEGFGLPCIEAYSFNLPVITSDIPVMREIMEENAFFVNPNNVLEIEKALLKVENLSKFSINQKFLNQYTWESVASKLLDIVSKTN